MSRKSRNVLLSGSATTSAPPPQTYKDQLLHMKFTMDQPLEQVYPLSRQAPLAYPDFCPWAEADAANARLTSPEYLHHGYFEAPLVPNEYFSARGLVQETLLALESAGRAVLQELSLTLAHAYQARHAAIDKIALAHTFRLPPRVTLTAAKRDAWLRDLANPDVPLARVAARIPHGIRNKVLLEHVCSLQVPVPRAVWFVRCVLCSEQQLLRRKVHARQHPLAVIAPTAPTAPGAPSALELVEARWLHEWTLQVADYVARFARDMLRVNSLDQKRRYQARLAYLLRLVTALYAELLLDRTCFLACVVDSLRAALPVLRDMLPELAAAAADADADDDCPPLMRLLDECPLNYGLILTAMALVDAFWGELCRHDYLCKQLGEALLLNYFVVERVPSAAVNLPSAPGAIPYALKEGLRSLLARTVVCLFRHNSNAFVLPDYWLLVGNVLYRVLEQSSVAAGENRPRFDAVFRLINYRNESLMLNMRYTAATVSDTMPRRKAALSSRSSLNSSISPGTRQPPTMHRSSDDILCYIEQLDALNLRSTLAASLRPVTSQSAEKWRKNVKIVIKWCSSAYRNMGQLAERVSVLCNYIKKKVLLPMIMRGSANLRAEFENEILESVFALAHEPRETLCMYNLFVLINEFYQLKVISLSSYLRKIIACGIFYISSLQSELDTKTQNDPQISFHLSILANLPVLDNKQHYQILSKWTPEGEKISSNYIRGMELSRTYVLKSLVTDVFPENFEEYLLEIKLFSVGVKFLLANWLTSQIKSTITQSPRLIHITPSTIARIYKFYVITDNLAVFFKNFMKYMLKNEDKVIIYYLDTLDYIGKLLQHHYLLVNFLPGSNSDRISVTYELYNLIIYAYQDLSSREPDPFDFRLLWEFMNLSVDKKISEALVNCQIKLHDPELERYIFSKETAESPLKVQVPAPRRNQVYSAELFVENLNHLLLTEPPRPSEGDIRDYCTEIGTQFLGISAEHFNQEIDTALKLRLLFQSWKVSSHALKECQDCAFFKLITYTKNMNGEDKKNHVMTSFIAAGIFDTPDYDELTRFLIKIICYRLLLLADIISMLSHPKDEQKSRFEHLSIKLIFDIGVNSPGLTQSESVMFHILQLEYRASNMDELFHLAILNIKYSNGVSRFEKLYSSSTEEVLMNLFTNNKEYAIPQISSQLPFDEIVNMCCKLLKTNHKIDSLHSCAQLASLINEFSLPIFQLLLRVIMFNKRPSEPEIGEAVLTLLDRCTFEIDPNNSYFGELFNFLEWEDKSMVFEHLELLFLAHRDALTKWGNYQDTNEDDNTSAFLKTNLQGIEILPVLKDVFKKFSVSSTESLEILLAKFEHFSSFLSQVIELVENDAIVKRFSRQLHDIISVFLRLVIIHSTSLTNIIAKHDSVHFMFLKHMMILLNSTYLANGQEKLKILLFDLLFQLKGSLTQALIVPTTELMETSPQTSGINIKNETSPDGIQLENASGTAANMTMSMILNLSEPCMSTYDFGSGDELGPLTLEDEEIYHNSDVALANDPNFSLVPKDESAELVDPFRANVKKCSRQFRIDSVGLIEDTSDGLNSGCLNLSMFGAYMTKENPY